MTTGGAEWKHRGPITLTIKDDGSRKRLGGFADVMREEFPWLVFRTIEVELKDEPGSLGAAAAALGDINIYAVTILDDRRANAVLGRSAGLARARRSRRPRRKQATRRDGGATRQDPDDADDSEWGDDWDDGRSVSCPISTTRHPRATTGGSTSDNPRRPTRSGGRAASGSWPAPTRTAIVAASTRLLTPSLSRMWVTWTLAVFGLMKSVSAISRVRAAGRDELEDLPLAR